MPAYTDMIRQWAEEVETYRKPVEVRIWFALHGGVKGAKAKARKIAMAFSSLRNYERRRVNKRIQAEGVPNQYKLDTPYQDIVCLTSVMEEDGCVLIEFLHGSALDTMFDVRGMGDAEARKPLEPLPDLAEMQRMEEPIPDALKPSADWMAGIPDDADPFAEVDGTP